MDLDRYEVRKQIGCLYSEKSMEIAGELIKTIAANELTYEEAKESLDVANQVILNKLLSKTKIRRSNQESR